MKIYIVFKTSILNMCYEIETFDCAFSTKELAEKYISDMKKCSDYERYLEEITLDTLN